MRKTVSLLMLSFLLLFICACGEGAEAVDGLILATGDEAGTYSRFGELLAQKVNSTTTTFVATVATEGSKENIRMLSTGEAHIAFAQYDAMLYARRGIITFREDGPNDSFSVVAALYPEAVHIVTLDPELVSVDALKGKRVSIGAVGSGGYFNAVDILGAYGLAETDIDEYNLSFSDSADALLSGKLDAAFMVAGAPVTAVSALAEERPVYLIPLDAAHIDALTAGDSVYRSAVIGSDVYGTPSDCPTVAVTAIIIADNDVSEADIYDFVRGVYDNIPSLESETLFADYLSRQLAASITTVPYHPGAARYYAEHGISVPTG